MNYSLSASDLTFLYDGCKHCFVLKVKHGISQPSIRLPAIFTIIAALQKEYYSGMRTERFCPSLPPGIVTYGEKRIRSDIIEFPDLSSTCYISGRFDIVAELDDGSYAVLDFKTGSPSEEKTSIYAPQLRAYALALENPAQGALRLSPVSRLGLLYFTPDVCEQKAATRQVLEGQMRWIEIGRDIDGFRAFLHDVVQLLDGPVPPANPETCDWCAYWAKIGQLQTLDGTAASPACPKCGGPMRLRKGPYGEFWSCTSFPECRGKRNP